MSESHTKAGNQKKFENLKIFRDIIIILVTRSTDIRVHRAGSQLKKLQQKINRPPIHSSSDTNYYGGPK